MNQTERIYQSKALTEGWGKIEIARPWWFDTSTDAYRVPELEQLP